MSGLPYRIRAPLARLQEKKKAPAEGKKEAGLGDGEKLETNSVGPDYVRLALTSRVYDFVNETPLQHASGLSQRLQVPPRLTHGCSSRTITCTRARWHTRTHAHTHSAHGAGRSTSQPCGAPQP